MLCAGGLCNLQCRELKLELERIPAQIFEAGSLSRLTRCPSSVSNLLLFNFRVSAFDAVYSIDPKRTNARSTTLTTFPHVHCVYCARSKLPSQSNFVMRPSNFHANALNDAVKIHPIWPLSDLICHTEYLTDGQRVKSHACQRHHDTHYIHNQQNHGSRHKTRHKHPIQH